MSNLSAFLVQNVEKTENIKYVVSKRFLDGNQKPIEWEVRCVTSSEDEELRRNCTKRVRVPGKKNQFTNETDYNLYLGKLAAACTVFPNLNNAELQSNYGVMGADSLLKAMLLPGEYANYLAKVQEVNGFDIDFDEMVEEAKN